MVKLLWSDVVTVASLSVLWLLGQRYVRDRYFWEDEKNNYNVTPAAVQDMLIFNRVPKVGSQTVWNLLNVLGKTNNFNSTSDSSKLKKKRGSENVYLSTGAQETYVNMWLKDIVRPFSYCKHISFINFEDFGYQNPIYINFVRHPVERVLSWYYYVRSPLYGYEFDENKGEYKVKAKHRIGELKRSFEDCFFERKQECVYDQGQEFSSGNGGAHYSQVGFFCGSHPECMHFGSEAAFQRAVSNVKKYYAVVGVLEEFDTSLTVLEKYVPRYFQNVTSVYNKRLLLNKNSYKPKISNRVRELLNANFTLELKFYEFCKDRLHRQFLLLN